MATLWDNMGFFSRKPKAETEGFETDWTVFLLVCVFCTGNDGHGSDMH